MICMIFGKNMIFYCCHSARRALARSCRIQMFLSRVNPSHPGKRSSQDGWGLLECRVVNPSPTVWDGPPSPNRRGVSSMVLDSATSPFGFAQNDKGEFFLTIVKYIKRGWRWWWIYYYIDLYLTAKTCTQGQWGISDRGDFWSQRKLFIYKTIYLMTEANFQQ